MGSTNHSMNNNNTGRRRKEKKDFSVDNNKVPKQQKMTTKADVMDMSAGITVNLLHEAEIPTTTTSGIGLRDTKGSKKDSIIDPANKKEVDEAIKSGSTLTDEATDLS
jgi:hypothetical protein